MDEKKIQHSGPQLSGLGGVEEEEVHSGGEVAPTLVFDVGEGGGI